VKILLTVLLLLLVSPVLAYQGQWCWPAVECADGYRVYAAAWGETWWLLVETDLAPDPPAQVCVTQPYEPAGPLVFFTVAAFNVAGESRKDHGHWPGDLDGTEPPGPTCWDSLPPLTAP